MSNAHGISSSLLLTLTLALGAAGTAACDSDTEATVARTVPDDNCVVDCEPDPDPNDCVMSPDRWVAQSFAVPDESPSELSDILCGLTSHEILTAPRDTPWVKVAQQYVTAQANVDHGASLPDDVAAAMDDARSFLMGCVPCPKIEASTAPALDKLTRYNAGEIGPDECECVVDCDECIIDCDPDGDLKCPAKVFGFTPN
jgi:hypothetical protein